MFRKTLPLYIDALLIKEDKEIEDIFFKSMTYLLKFVIMKLIFIR